MKIAGLEIKIHRNVLSTYVGMVVLFSLIIFVIGQLTDDFDGFPIVEIVLIAAGGALYFYFGQFFHLWGHAIAAWLTGYPKSGMVIFYIFGMSQYPPDEPELPDSVHIQRSMGGVVATTILLAVTVLLWLSGRNSPEWTIRYLTSLMLFDAALLFFVSAFISDGVLFLIKKDWRHPEALPF